MYMIKIVTNMFCIFSQKMEHKNKWRFIKSNFPTKMFLVGRKSSSPVQCADHTPTFKKLRLQCLWWKVQSIVGSDTARDKTLPGWLLRCYACYHLVAMLLILMSNYLFCLKKSPLPDSHFILLTEACLPACHCIWQLQDSPTQAEQNTRVVMAQCVRLLLRCLQCVVQRKIDSLHTASGHHQINKTNVVYRYLIKPHLPISSLKSVWTCLQEIIADSSVLAFPFRWLETVWAVWAEQQRDSRKHKKRNRSYMSEL